MVPAGAARMIGGTPRGPREHTVDGTMELDTAEITDDSTDDEMIDDELLVEEISIDGMCGVY